MKISKIVSNLILVIFFILFFQNVIYSIGVYSQFDGFVYYTNNSLPEIKVNLSSPGETITIVNASFSIDGVVQVENYNEQLSPSVDSKVFSLISNKDITEYSNNFFEIYAYGNSDSKKIIPLGDPTNFIVKLDNIKPNLISNNNLYLIDRVSFQTINLNFDEKILSYDFIVNGSKKISYLNPSKFEEDFQNIFVENLTSDLFVEGNNTIRLEFKDLAGNQNFVELEVFFRGPPIEVKLITNKEDSSLKYFYNSNYSSFFEKTIYSSEEIYNLKIETSKEANCYLGYSLNNYIPFESLTTNNKKIFNSQDNLIHTIEINTPDRVLVVCQNLLDGFQDEIIYLNDELNISNDLIKLRFDDPSVNFNFIKTFPNGDLTTNLVNFNIATSKKAVCFYKLDNQVETQTMSLNWINHNQNDVEIEDNNHEVNFKCFDVLGNEIFKSQLFNVDSTKGIQISDLNIKYTDSSIVNLNFSISNDQAECKYTKDVRFNPGGDVSFDNLSTNILGDGFFRYFRTETLTKGLNIYYANCRFNGNINENKIEIIYDPDGPRLSNLRFINNGIESNYVGSFSDINFKFDVNSSIDIGRYFIEIVKDDGSLFHEVYSNIVSLNTNLSGAKSIKILGENLIFKNSSVLESKILFDLDKPQINVLMDGQNFKITCFDIQTGNCQNILYSFSKTSLDCTPNLNYNLNSSISFSNNNYVCVKGFDRVGNFAELIKPLILGFDRNNNIDNNTNSINLNNTNSSNGNNTIDNNLNESSKNFNKEIDPFLPSDFSNTQETNETNYLLIGAIFMLLAGVSGGGYYAYKKGYLNNQLEKLGIKKNLSKNNNFISSTNIVNKVLTKTNSFINSKKVKKSSYDEHLNKLNNFIDEKLNIGNKVFDKFSEDNQKGKVKGYEDTLIKGKKIDKDDLTKEEFDEFYSSSKENDKFKTTNLEKDSEAFEEYYKNKKIEPKSKDKKSKK